MRFDDEDHDASGSSLTQDRHEINLLDSALSPKPLNCCHFFLLEDIKIYRIFSFASAILFNQATARHRVKLC